MACSPIRWGAPRSQPSAQRTLDCSPPPFPHSSAGTAGPSASADLLPIMSSSSLSSATNSTSSSVAKVKKHLDHNLDHNTVAPPQVHPVSSHPIYPQPSLGHPACAACKYQRRKCTPECLLAPYFPANLQQQFLNAHRLFGVKNILRIIKDLNPVERANAMHSIVYESNMRASCPVDGCLRIIHELECQVQNECMELALILQQISICRAQAGEGAGQTSSMAVNLDATNPCNVNGNDNMMQRPYYNYFYNSDDNNNINVVDGSNNDSGTNNENNNSDNNKDQGELEMQAEALSLLTLQRHLDMKDVKPLV